MYEVLLRVIQRLGNNWDENQAFPNSLHSYTQLLQWDTAGGPSTQGQLEGDQRVSAVVGDESAQNQDTSSGS